MMTMATVFLGFNAVAIGLIGLGYLYNPNLLLARYGLETGSAAMDNMLRGAYGGLFVGVAAAFAYGAFVPARTTDALLLTLLFMGGFALGRGVSIVRVGSPGRLVSGLLGYEIITSILSAILYARLAS